MSSSSRAIYRPLAYDELFIYFIFFFQIDFLFILWQFCPFWNFLCHKLIWTLNLCRQNFYSFRICQWDQFRLITFVCVRRESFVELLCFMFLLCVRVCDCRDTSNKQKFYYSVLFLFLFIYHFIDDRTIHSSIYWCRFIWTFLAKWEYQKIWRKSKLYFEHALILSSFFLSLSLPPKKVKHVRALLKRTYSSPNFLCARNKYVFFSFLVCSFCLIRYHLFTLKMHFYFTLLFFNA